MHSSRLRHLLSGALFSLLVVSTTACGLMNIDPVDQAIVESTQTSDVETLAVSTGAKAPDFELVDGEGQSHRLSTILQDKAALLIFYRGDWCPFCIDQLDSINAVLADLSAQGVQVIGISPDASSAVQNTERRFGQDFIFLSDEGSKTIAQYGIAKDEKLPHPAQFLIAKDGSVKWLYAGTNYRERPTGKQLMEAVKKHL